MAWGRGGSFNSCDALLGRVEKNDPKLVELVILPMKSFGAKDLERLSNALGSSVNTHLVSISASGHHLPPSSLKAFGAALSVQAQKKHQNVGITRLAIGSKDMGDDGVISLCEGLATTNGALLQHLDLGWKQIGKDGLYEIGKTFIHSRFLSRLDLSRNDFGNDGMVQLNKAATLSKKENDDICDDRDGDVAFPALEMLILAECNIGSAGMNMLTEILLGHNNTRRSKRIQLSISSNPIGSGGCQPLKRLLSCEDHGSIVSHLQAAQCNIGDVGIGILSKCRQEHVECLDISDNNITSDGAKLLAQSLRHSWPDLVELKLAKNKLGSEGVTAIFRSLVTRSDDEITGSFADRNSSLKNLDLSYTNCGAEGAKAAVMSGGLTTLRLFGNKIGSNGFDAIAPLLRGGHPNIKNLDLGGNNAEEDSVVRLLDAIADKKVDSTHSRLAVLEIGGNKFGDKAMDALKRLKHVLPDLDVAHDMPVGESGWQAEDQ